MWEDTLLNGSNVVMFYTENKSSDGRTNRVRETLAVAYEGGG